jgi:hypothetical protein
VDSEAALNFIDEESKHVEASMLSSQTLRWVSIGDHAVSEIDFNSIDDSDLARILNPLTTTQEWKQSHFRRDQARFPEAELNELLLFHHERALASNAALCKHSTPCTGATACSCRRPYIFRHPLQPRRGFGQQSLCI